MRKKKYTALIFPVMLLLLFSCKEVYYPEGLNKGKAIPIIQGKIAEDESPTVVISRAMVYESSTPDYISGAEVIVSDNKGNEATLSESTPGHYVAAERQIFGVVGTTYKLNVKIDGEEFESSMVTMPAKPIVDSLYAEPGTKLTYTYDEANKPVSVTYEGLYIATSLSAKGDSTLFYRFNTTVLTESTRIRNPNSPSATLMFIWQVSPLDNIYSVDFTVNSAGRQVRPQHQLGFCRYFYDPSLASRTYSAPVIIGYIVTFKVYAISPDVYYYYQSIGTQLNSNDEMFAPVPSQVKSNIHCTSNPELPVVGVFEASSSATFYKAFKWVSMDTYKYIDLESFPEDIPSGTKLYLPPSFWISFN